MSIKNRYTVYIFWSIILPLLIWYGIPGLDLFIRMVAFAIGFMLIDVIVKAFRK